MSKTLIREDEGGLYANVGGWKVRPSTAITRIRTGYGEEPDSALKAGDHVQASHSGGPMARVGGEYWWIERESDWTLKVLEKYQ